MNYKHITINERCCKVYRKYIIFEKWQKMYYYSKMYKIYRQIIIGG